MRSDYFYFLSDLIGGSSKNEDLLYNLYSVPFHYAIDLDWNRAAAGLNLRDRFAYLGGVNDNVGPSKDASVLEVLIGLSLNMANQTGEEPAKWFWEMVSNLHLTTNHFKETLQIWMNRKFSYDGSGSPFPLRHPVKDQRQLQIWDQMACYLNERSSKRSYL